MPVDAAAFGDQPARNGQRAGGAQDAVADDAGRDRGAGDHIGQIGLRGQDIAAWCGEVDTREAIDIAADVGIRNAKRQHRFVVPHQPRAGDPRRGVTATSTSSGRPE